MRKISTRAPKKTQHFTTICYRKPSTMSKAHTVLSIRIVSLPLPSCLHWLRKEVRSTSSIEKLTTSRTTSVSHLNQSYQRIP